MSETESSKKSSPFLIKDKNDAAKLLELQISKGNKLIERTINDKGSLDEAYLEKDRWVEYTVTLISTLIENSDELVDNFRTVGCSRIIDWDDNFNEDVRGFKDDVREHVSVLTSISERLDLYEQSVPTPVSSTEKISRDVFVVHGHAMDKVQTVARLLEKLKLKPIILHEQENEGQAVIEKFEKHANNVPYAVVLLTPDDMGYAKDTPEKAQGRARQNVIFELGYFFGKLGRNRVCALYTEGIEIPSDLSGLLYEPIDKDGWDLKLAKEMRKSGIEIDMNLL